MPRPLVGPVVLPRPLPNNGGGAGAFEIFELGGGGGGDLQRGEGRAEPVQRLQEEGWTYGIQLPVWELVLRTPPLLRQARLQVRLPDCCQGRHCQG